MSRPPDKASDPAAGEALKELLTKKKKKGKGNPVVQPATAAAAVKDKPTVVKPQAPPVPTPSYCFRCGDESHTSKQCKHQGELKCDNHAN